MQLRTHENGGICCSTFNSRGEHGLPKHPCDKCKAHFAKSRIRTLITQESHMEDFTPPDPYAAGIAALRAANEKTAAVRMNTLPPRPTEMPLDANGIPDPYAAGLAQMRREGR